MPISIAKLFIDELSGWQDIIDSHFEEVREFEKKLSDLISSNTIPRLAENAELYLTRFSSQRHNFFLLSTKILEMRAKLLKEMAPVPNELVTDGIKTEQNSLRETMQHTEKEYIDLKFSCQKFFSETFGE